MASAEHEPITGVWGQSPQRGPGAEPLVRGAKFAGAKFAPWSWKRFGHWMSNRAGKFSPFPKMHLYFYTRCNGNDMGKIYVEIQGGSGDPPCPFLGAPMLTMHSCCNKEKDVVAKCHTWSTVGQSLMVSVNKSYLVYSSLIFVDNKLILQTETVTNCCYVNRHLSVSVCNVSLLSTNIKLL